MKKEFIGEFVLNGKEVELYRFDMSENYNHLADIVVKAGESHYLSIRSRIEDRDATTFEMHKELFLKMFN